MRANNQVVSVTCVAALFSLLWIERIDVEQFFGNFCTSSRTSFSHSGKAVASEAPTATTAITPSTSAYPYATTPDLLPLPICSAAAADSGLKGCTITSKGGHNEVKVDLTAQNASVHVGGYDVVTENYGDYRTPVIEAMPGDTVAARLENKLDPQMMAGGMAADDNPTNLHYFHGGIVSPNNGNSGQSPDRAESGNGDNIYVRLDRGKSFDFEVPIPDKDARDTKYKLDARVLEGRVGDYIDHPSGLNWYHSHLHMISTQQVLGGMSGLLSVGEPTANLKSDNSSDTDLLKKRTDVKYVLLRDLPLQDVSKQPEEAENTVATWAPTASLPAGTPCGVYKDGKLETDVTRRKGFCQYAITDDKGNRQKITWLFTLNGQRFPTITVEAGKNVLLRIGNLSANVGYWLEADNEDPKAEKKLLQLSLIGLDGIVPARPQQPENADTPIAANNVNNLLLMPASRAEIYVRNDENKHDDEQDFILSSKGLLGIGDDDWPQVQLARIVLKRNPIANPLPLSLNAPVAIAVAALTERFAVENVNPPAGCVEDLNPASKEYRRVAFFGGEPPGTPWAVRTEVVRPGNSDNGTGGTRISIVQPDPHVSAENGVTFEAYLDPSHRHIVWTRQHTCIKLDHKGSHEQLWVLVNATSTLHNFHIHQMKFRLARKAELADRGITPGRAHTCDPAQPGGPPPDECNGGPNYDLYDDGSASPDPEAVRWHDTIPVPPTGDPVYIVMSFDATQQVGRFVYHCHILKHEDAGLMAPIEVWDPNGPVTLPN
jgi:FtsP/CotA-like multicopper oxidase with cupredoxin domain